MSNTAIKGLVTRAADIVSSLGGSAPAFTQFGGTTIYAPDEQVLQEALRTISYTITTVAARYSCIRPNHLFGLCRRELPIDMRLFRPCLNAEARYGRIELVRCLSNNAKPFKVVVEANRLEEFRTRVFQIIQLAQGTSTVRVRQVQDTYYPDRAKGTWFVAQQMLQRAMYLGYLIPQDEWSFKVPETLSDARAEISGKLDPPEPARLA